MRYGRYLEIALGILFIVSAALKALDIYAFAVQVSAYNVVRDRMLVQVIAYAMIALEAALGAALLGGYRFKGLTHAATGALLVVFSGLIAYAWIFHGLADCGCFGAYIKMGPASSIAKNVVLLVVLAAAWWGTSRNALHTAPTEGEAAELPAAKSASGHIMAAIGLAVVGGAYALSDAQQTRNVTPPTTSTTESQQEAVQGRFANYVPELDGNQFPLATGEHLVAMLSASCEHCMEAVAVLNELVDFPDVPPVSALVMGNEEEINVFKATTGPMFAVQAIDTLEFMERIGSAPPRFYIIRDGAEVRHLDPQDPESKAIRDITFDELLAFATQDTTP